MSKEKSREPKPGTIWWAFKLHPASAAPIVETKRGGHIKFEIEGKERPAILLRNRPKRENQHHFEAAFLTTKSTDSKDRLRTSVFPCPIGSDGDSDSFVETPTAEISENLLTRFKCDIERLAFEAFKRQLSSFLLQSHRPSHDKSRSTQ